jgi:hypothetical protein
VIVGFGGQLVVTDGSNAVTVYAPGASGDAVPTQEISGPATDLTDADDAALDSAGDIFVTNFDTGGVVEFASGATGNVAPIATLSGSTTTLEEPEGVAVAGPPATVSAGVTTQASPSQSSVGDPVSDTATVSGGTNPSGQIVFKLYGPNDPTCSLAPAYTSAPVTVSGDGAYPSGTFDPAASGTYSWVASYSGDTNNAPVTTACGDPNETVTVAAASAQPTQISTSLSGGGQTGTDITVPSGTVVTDQATLTGANAGSATGSVEYSIYSDSNCTHEVASSETPITTPGSLPQSSGFGFSSGTYYWEAAYGGDPSNQASSSACGSEVVTYAAPQPEPVSVWTELSGGGQSAPQIFVPNGSSVSDQATLSGANTASAGGTLTYSVYVDPGCTIPAAASQTVSVTGGSVPASSPVVLPQGTYFWQASYSGDALNDPQLSTCDAETSVVLGTARFGADVGVSLFTYPSSTITAGGGDDVICLTVTNYGPKAAKNIISGLVVPSGLSVVDSNGAIQIGRLLIWKTGTFAPGDTETYHVWVSPTGSATGSASLKSGALSLGTLDPNYANNFASESLTFSGSRHVSFRLSHSRAGASVLLARLRAAGRGLTPHRR